ncbi:Fic family protein [Candidatus Palauibacter sp.]|uniref:Fic family protein n=1 Tax=Candidatus Palauibacter sp. TaxID=3101350 RepID=UPI003B58ED67
MNRALDELPEAFVSHTAISRDVSRAVKAGTLRKLASRLYTKNLDDPPEDVVRRNLWTIVAGYFPGALVADRTALDMTPAPDGSVCLVSERGRTVELPGIVLRPRRGSGPTASDMSFVNGLHMSSRARAYLQNLRPSRARSGRVPRTFSQAQIEEALDRLIRQGGETAVNHLRDEARVVAAELGLETEAVRLDALIGALLGTRRSQLDSPLARARSRGNAYDPDRMELFHKLHRALRDHPPSVRSAPRRDAQGRATLAFFEAYFSNFVEGTEFLVDEAVRIVFEGEIPQRRPADARDVVGTWSLVSDPQEMTRTPRDPAGLTSLLRDRHRQIMAGRPEMRPGEFKDAPNQAGNTHFVLPHLVPGTLEQGFSLYHSLESPFARAVYMMFLVAEVHPFADGNGRVARVMMNAELVAAGEERIIIPTVFRNNYLAALRALSRTDRRPQPLIDMLYYAQRWTLAVDWTSLRETQRELEACHAFLDSDEAEREGKRLRMPAMRSGAGGPAAV